MRILFQGDSITDAERIRENDLNMGSGYPLLVKATLGFENPSEYEFFNRGIGGDRIVDIYARMKRDILNLKPDVMSILVGVNDVWHELAPVSNGVDAGKYFKVYSMLIEEIKEALPNIKIMIMEPFVLKTGAPLDDWGYFSEEVKKRAEMAKKIAEKYNLKFIPLQAGFDELCLKKEESHWLTDGVHPSPMGHEYIKRQWLDAFKSL